MKNKKPSKICTPTYISKFLPISQNGDISVLVSKSKAPKRKRQKKRDPKIIDFIYQLRKQHPNKGLK